MAPSPHCADILAEAVQKSGGAVCVGLDPVLAKLPSELSDRAPAIAIRDFSLGVVDAVTGIAAAVKFQSACFERYGHQGIKALEDATAHAESRGLVVILDGKRGDIGISAEHYAAAARINFHADWCTVNPYLGLDSVAPFLSEAGGAFALVRTSNPAGDELQCLTLRTGDSLSLAVAKSVAKWGAGSIGKCGYSSLGAVVGATKPAEIAALREVMPTQWFLVPGYGAQGGSAHDVIACFDGNGLGALITASRSVIFPPATGADWRSDISRAAEAMRDELGAALTSSEGGR